MELALRKRVVLPPVKGGWWNGLGDDSCPYIDDTGFCTDFDPNAIIPTPPGADPTWDQETTAAYQAMLDYAAAHPGDTGVPASGPVDYTLMLQAITDLAKIGIQAIAPNTVTGACPAGYVRSGAACAPISSAPHTQQASLIPGLSNNTLLLAGGGLLLLMMLTGGKRR